MNDHLLNPHPGLRRPLSEGAADVRRREQQPEGYPETAWRYNYAAHWRPEEARLNDLWLRRVIFWPDELTTPYRAEVLPEN